MEICKVHIETSNDNIVNEIKIFDNPMEINQYAASLNEQKQIAEIKMYNMHMLLESDIKSMKAEEVLKLMPLESFIKLIKYLLREPTIKTF